MTLPRIVRSGVTPYTPCAPPNAIRNPVITSSNTSSAPASEHRSRRPSRNPGSGGTTPMFAATGSTIAAAIRSPVLGEHPVDRCEVVERHRERVARGALGHARRPGDPERRHAAPGSLREQRVRVPVVAALELQDEVPSRTSAREADRAHRGLGAARHEPDHLDRGHRGDDPFGELDLELGRGSERGAARGRRASRVDDLGARVSEQERAPRLHEVDVAPAVGVDEVRALAPDGEPRGPAHRAERPHRRVHPAGDHAPGPLEQLLGAGHERFRTTASRPRPSRGT